MKIEVTKQTVIKEKFYVDADNEQQATDYITDYMDDITGRVVKREATYTSKQLNNFPELGYEETVFPAGNNTKIYTLHASNGNYDFKARCDHEALRIANIIYQYGSCKPNFFDDYDCEILDVIDEDGNKIGDYVDLDEEE